MIEIDVNMTFTYTPEALWSMICGSAWESWEWWYGWRYEGGDWDKPCDLWVIVDNPWEDNEQVSPLAADNTLCALVTLPDIVRAIEELKDHSTVMDCLRNEDFDAVYGDVVMQQAVFGEVIYG